MRAEEAVPTVPRPRRGRRFMGASVCASDAALLARVTCTNEPERAAVARYLRGALRGLGLAALARLPAFEWPPEWPLDEQARRRLAAAFELGRRAFASGGPALVQPDDVFAWCSDLRTANRERFVGLYLDARHRVLRRRLVSIGTLTASLVHPREVLGPALRVRAAALVVVHNHPSGDPEPSPEDCALTERLRDAARLLGLDLLDHVVVAREGFVSMRQRGYL